MKRTFKEVPSFTTKWQSLGLTDEDLRTLENILLKNPKIEDVITGTGGIRKLRIPIDNVGKRKNRPYSKRKESFKETCRCLKGGMIMGFYEDMEKSLSEAIEMEKGNIPLTSKENMPAPTFAVASINQKD